MEVRDVPVDQQKTRLQSYLSYDEESGDYVMQLLQDAKNSQNPQLPAVVLTNVNNVLNDLRCQKLPIYKLVDTKSI